MKTYRGFCALLVLMVAGIFLASCSGVPSTAYNPGKEEAVKSGAKIENNPETANYVSRSQIRGNILEVLQGKWDGETYNADDANTPNGGKGELVFNGKEVHFSTDNLLVQHYHHGFFSSSRSGHGAYHREVKIEADSGKIFFDNHDRRHQMIFWLEDEGKTLKGYVNDQKSAHWIFHKVSN